MAGNTPVYADEAQPTAQPLETPTTAVQVQTTEVPPGEPTAHIAPTELPSPPTETPLVIEISTEVASPPPTEAPPPPVPTDPVPTAEVLDPAPTGPTIVFEEPVATQVTVEETATLDVPTPVPTIADVLLTLEVPTAVLVATETPDLLYAATPYWLPPGPECALDPGEIVVKLPVPYVHQVLDVGNADGNWACGPTSVVMVLAYYGKLEPWPAYVARQAASTVSTATPQPATSTATSTQPTATRTATQKTVPPTSTRTSTSTLAPSRTPTHTSTVAPTSTKTLVPRKGVATKAVRPVTTSAQSIRAVGRSFGPYVSSVYTNNGFTYNGTSRDPRGSSVAGLYGTICPTGLADWGRMGTVLQRHGLTSRHISVTWEGVTEALDRGHPVIIGNDLTSVGHILVAVGYTTNGNLIVNDPYGNRFAPGYGGTSGDGLFYAWNCTLARNALEVIGTYSPPPEPTTQGTPFTILAVEGSPTIAASPTSTVMARRSQEPALWYQGATRRVMTTLREVRRSAEVAPKIAPPTPAVEVAGRVLNTGGDREMLGWGLFSIFGIVALAAGVHSLKKTFDDVGDAALPERSEQVPSLVIASDE